MRKRANTRYGSNFCLNHVEHGVYCIDSYRVLCFSCKNRFEKGTLNCSADLIPLYNHKNDIRLSYTSKEFLLFEYYGYDRRYYSYWYGYFKKSQRLMEIISTIRYRTCKKLLMYYKKCIPMDIIYIILSF